jgi:hypothetical protein
MPAIPEIGRLPTNEGKMRYTIILILLLSCGARFESRISASVDQATRLLERITQVEKDIKELMYNNPLNSPAIARLLVKWRRLVDKYKVHIIKHNLLCEKHKRPDLKLERLHYDDL